MSELVEVKIKQEKITPPPSPKCEPPNQNTEEGESIGLFRKIINDEPIETKGFVEPIKSSNQILVELFQVFNAAPPEVDNADDSKDSHSKKAKKTKKKHKKEKKIERNSKKKHKKRKKREKCDIKSEPVSGDNNDTSSSSSEHCAAPISYVKRIKLEVDDEIVKKRMKRGLTEDGQSTKEERLGESNERSNSRTRESSLKNKQSSSTDDKKARTESQTEKSTASASGLSTRSKIVIKSLVDSDFYKKNIKEAERQEKRKSHSEKPISSTSRADDDNDSAFSISDEDEYWKDRETSSYQRRLSCERERDIHGQDSSRRSSERESRRRRDNRSADRRRDYDRREIEHGRHRDRITRREYHSRSDKRYIYFVLILFYESNILH